MNLSPSIRPALLAFAVAAIAGPAICVAVANGATRPTTAAHTSGVTATVALKHTPLGNVLVDARGRTLYLFFKDRKRQSLCTASCAQFWPPLLSTGKPRAAAGVRAPLIGVITRKDRSHQVTYAGHPLYTFVADTRPGQTNGEGSTNFGAPWYVVAANGHAIKGA